MIKFDLQRFVDAQDSVYAQVVKELIASHKQSHWMWFIFPQIEGLGRSATAVRYALAGLEEAKAYIAHPVLGSRLRECTNLANKVQGKSAYAIFSTPDDIKFRSCMTLFAQATPENTEFKKALQLYFEGKEDEATLHILYGSLR